MTDPTEREAIVAYLRGEFLERLSVFAQASISAVKDAADAIESGDHLKDQDHDRA